MSGEFSDKGADIALDAVSGRATQSARTMYLAFLTSAPSDTTTMSTMSEITTPGTNGYTRPAVTPTAPGSDGAGARETHNSGAITDGPFTSDLSNCTHAALVSASSGTSGDLVFWWALTSARDPANGDSFSVADSALVMKAD
jgi:hypothetical protein